MLINRPSMITTLHNSYCITNKKISIYREGILFWGFKFSWIAISEYFHGFIFLRVYACNPKHFRQKMILWFKGTTFTRDGRPVADRYFLVYEKWMILLPYLSWEIVVSSVIFQKNHCLAACLLFLQNWGSIKCTVTQFSRSCPGWAWDTMTADVLVCNGCYQQIVLWALSIYIFMNGK